MIDVPLNAAVECTDGPCGESVTIIVNPVTSQVEFFVVLDKTTKPAVQRLVPMSQVADSTPSKILLKCKIADVQAMDPFIDTQYVKVEQMVSHPSYDGYAMPYTTAMSSEVVDSAVETELVPEGALAIHRGTRVEATDGGVGQVGELVMDPVSGKITHFTLQEGNFRGKKQITLPMTTIKRFADDTVYLKLTKHDIGMLPSIPLKRRYDRAIGGTSMELLAKVYDDVDGAATQLEELKEYNKRGTIKIKNAAVLVKDKDGKASWKELHDLDVKHGRLFGAIGGGLLALTGPVGLVAGAIAGGAAGGVSSRLLDLGFSDDFLKLLQDRMKPGTSGLLVMVEHDMLAPLNKQLANRPGIILSETLTDAVVQQLMDENQEKK